MLTMVVVVSGSDIYSRKASDPLLCVGVEPNALHGASAQASSRPPVIKWIVYVPQQSQYIEELKR